MGLSSFLASSKIISYCFLRIDNLTSLKRSYFEEDGHLASTKMAKILYGLFCNNVKENPIQIA